MVRRRRSTEGISLLEAALLICLVATLLAVFVPTFIRHLRTSKIAEASEQLANLHQAVAAYYEEGHEVGGRRLRRCVPAEAGPAPAEPSPDAIAVDFAAEATPGHATWQAIGFQPEGPLRYRYSLYPEAVGCGVAGEPGRPLLTIRAEGDLDDDGELSTFERSLAPGEHGLVPHGILTVIDRVE